MDFLKAHHGELSVLIHQDTGDDAIDHSENIVCLGEPVVLDFGFFELIKSRPDLKINSFSGLNGLPGMGYYDASNAFVSTFCESLACDLVHEGIHAICVHPSFIETPLTAGN